MDEIWKLLIGAAVLVSGFFLGNWIANITGEEIKKGKKWFFLIVILGLAGGVYGLVSKNDFLLFTMFFIAIVASRSLRRSLEMEGQTGGEKESESDEEEKKPKEKDKKSKDKNSKEAKKSEPEISYSDKKEK